MTAREFSLFFNNSSLRENHANEVQDGFSVFDIRLLVLEKFYQPFVYLILYCCFFQPISWNFEMKISLKIFFLHLTISIIEYVENKNSMFYGFLFQKVQKTPYL